MADTVKRKVTITLMFPMEISKSLAHQIVERCEQLHKVRAYVAKNNPKRIGSKRVLNSLLFEQTKAEFPDVPPKDINTAIGDVASIYRKYNGNVNRLSKRINKLRRNHQPVPKRLERQYNEALKTLPRVNYIPAVPFVSGQFWLDQLASHETVRLSGFIKQHPLPIKTKYHPYAKSKLFGYDLNKIVRCELRRHLNKRWYLHVFVPYETENTIDVRSPIAGVAMGYDPLYVTSTQMQPVSAKTVVDKIKWRNTVRKRLLIKNTRSAKRRLMRVNRHLKNFMNNVCHVQSRRVVRNLLLHGCRTLSMPVTRMFGVPNDDERAIEFLKTWPFRKFQRYIEYKSILAGLVSVMVKDHNLAYMCPHCGVVRPNGVTKDHTFRCPECGWEYSYMGNIANCASQLGLERLRDMLNNPV